MTSRANIINNADRIERQLAEFETTNNFLRTAKATVKVQGAVRVRKVNYDASNSWILGHPTNGYLGSGYNGLGGGQIVIGSDGNETETTDRLGWKNNEFKEFLSHKDFILSGTSYVNSSTHRIDLDDGNNVYYLVAKDTGETYEFVTVDIPTDSTRTNMNFNRGDTLPAELPATLEGSTQLYVSADGGSNYERVFLKTQKQLTNTGSEIRLRITSTEDGRFFLTEGDNGKHLPIKVSYR